MFKKVDSHKVKHQYLSNVMKIIFTFNTILLISMQTALVAQTSDALDYLVPNFGDTLYGTVKHINQKTVNPEFYKKIRITDTNGKKKKLKRKDVSAFRISATNYESFWLNQSSEKIVFLNPKYDINSQNSEQYFLRVVSKGRLSHYQLEWWGQEENTLSCMDVLKKDKDQFFMRANQGLFGLKRKVLIKYFSNCPDLKEKIEEKRISEVDQLVDFYNSNCID